MSSIITPGSLLMDTESSSKVTFGFDTDGTMGFQDEPD